MRGFRAHPPFTECVVCRPARPSQNGVVVVVVVVVVVGGGGGGSRGSAMTRQAVRQSHAKRYF